MLTRWEQVTAWELEAERSLGVLVAGSTEQHSDYLPLGTDSLIGERLACEAAKRANVPVLLLPVQHIGFSAHHRAFPGVLTLGGDVMTAYFTQLCFSAMEAGLSRLLILNAHGGNQTALQAVVNRLGAEFGRTAVLARYWDLIAHRIGEVRRSPPGGMGHAGELETSLMLHYYPELVRARRIDSRPPAQGDDWHHPDMFARNRIYRFIPFEQYSALGNVGQAQLASAEEGAQLADMLTQELAGLMEYVYALPPYTGGERKQ